jgi:hypothetical protein
MRRARGIITGMVEGCVAVWLLWKASHGYLLSGGAGGVTLPLILYVPLAIAQWLCFRGVLTQNRLIKLIVPLGLAVFLAVYMCINLSWQVNLIRRPGASTKEMLDVASQLGIPVEVRPQWYDREVQYVRSGRNDFVVLACVLLVLYYVEASPRLGGPVV